MAKTKHYRQFSMNGVSPWKSQSIFERHTLAKSHVQSPLFWSSFIIIDICSESCPVCCFISSDRHPTSRLYATDQPSGTIYPDESTKSSVFFPWLVSWSLPPSFCRPQKKISASGRIFVAQITNSRPAVDKVTITKKWPYQKTTICSNILSLAS